MNNDGNAVPTGKPYASGSNAMSDTPTTAATTPNFVVAGAARSGTTALTEALRSHPDVFVTTPKEPHYLALAGRNLDFAGPGDEVMVNREAITSTDVYLDLYPQVHQYLALGEGSVSTLYYYDRSIPRLLSMSPDVRVVLLLRDPVARAHSSFQFLRAQGYEPLDDFLAAVEDEPRRVREDWHHLWHYVRMSYYADSVEFVTKALGRDQVGIWFYDELVSDPAGTLDEVLRFLGTDPAKLPPGALWETNVSGTPKSRHLQSLYWWARRQELLRRTVRLAPFKLRQRLRNANLQPTPLPPEARRELGELFADDLSRLPEIIGRPLPHWDHP